MTRVTGSDKRLHRVTGDDKLEGVTRGYRG